MYFVSRSELVVLFVFAAFWLRGVPLFTERSPKAKVVFGSAEEEKERKGGDRHRSLHNVPRIDLSCYCRSEREK